MRTPPPHHQRCVSRASGSTFCLHICHAPTAPLMQDWAHDQSVSVGTRRPLVPGAQDFVECRTTHLTEFALVPALQVTSVSGCDDFYPVTVRCPTSSTVPITIRGANFGVEGAQVTFAGGGLSAECTEVTHDPAAADSFLRCRAYRPLFDAGADVLLGAAAQTLQVTVRTLTGLSFTHAFMGIAFAKRPIVTAITGCSPQGPAHTSDCFTDGRLPITVHGHNFRGFDVLLRIAGVPCDRNAQVLCAAVPCARVPVCPRPLLSPGPGAGYC